MSWLFSRALVEEFLAANCLDGEPSAQLNVMPTQHPFWCNDKTMDSWSPSQFGLTCAPLTAARGEAWLTLYRAGFHARTSAAQADEQVSTVTHQDSGEKWRGSLGKYDPASRSWRTHQTSLFEGSTEFLPTLPTWGLMRDGELWEQPIPDFPMSGSAHGSWPTPKARDWRSGGTDPAKVQARIDRRKNQGVIDLPDAAVHRLWQPGFSGQLKPSFSESLMDWPIGWTACEPLETGKFQQWLQQHGKFLEAAAHEA